MNARDAYGDIECSEARPPRLAGPEVRRASTVVGDTGALIVPKVLMADGHNGPGHIDTPSRPLEAWQVRVAVVRTLISPGTELHYLDPAVRTGSRHPLGYRAAARVTEGRYEGQRCADSPYTVSS